MMDGTNSSAARLYPSREGDEQPLRILCLNYEYPPMGGGAGNATHNTAVGLAGRGHTVHVLTAKLPDQPAVECLDGIVVHRVRSFRRSIMDCGLFGAASYLLFAFFALIRLERKHRYDVYQFYFGMPTGLLALYVHLVLKKPYVLALRGSDVPGYDDTNWYMAPLHRLLAPLTRYLWRRAARVTVLSRDLGELARRTCPQLETVLIANAVDADVFPTKADSTQNGRLRLLTVCRMVRRKGLQFLIEAMRELKDEGVELDLIGSGQEWHTVAQLVQKHSLQDCVTMLGYVPRDQLYQYYHQADIFVLPSLSESFGQVLLEAMSCGLPVIATAVGGIPETIRPERNGLLIPPSDSQKLVEAVRYLAARPALRDEIGRNNATHVRKHYSWSAVAARYESLYRDVLVGEREESASIVEPRWAERGKSR